MVKNAIFVSTVESGTDDPQSGRGSRADPAPEHYVIEEETDFELVSYLLLGRKYKIRWSKHLE